MGFRLVEIRCGVTQEEAGGTCMRCELPSRRYQQATYYLESTVLLLQRRDICGQVYLLLPVVLEAVDTCCTLVACFYMLGIGITITCSTGFSMAAFPISVVGGMLGFNPRRESS